jgi:hypothetical protein
MLLAIDPGTRESGFVILSDDCRVLRSGNESNQKILQEILRPSVKLVVVEEVAYANMAGWTLFRTSWWCGAMCLLAHQAGKPYHLLSRNEVKSSLGLSGQKDADVRRLCIAQYGGNEAQAIGTARDSGPLYTVTGHAWQALGLAIAWNIRHGSTRFQAAERKPKKPKSKKRKSGDPVAE